MLTLPKPELNECNKTIISLACGFAIKVGV